MDTIDVSNLNRQFLFRHSDVGKYKAEVAAKFVEKRVKGVQITPHTCMIQEKDTEFYMQFQMVVCGLDSIEARRWINAELFNMVDVEVPDSLKYLIDGGTEGFMGQVRVIVPTMTSCIECQLDLHAPRAAVPLCTLATIPRQPEHCIEWAHIMAWEQEKPFPKLDNDDPVHITWLYRKALERAKEFNISGVTYSLTQGVVKNIIPAIASTNAIIAAACCNEAFKIATNAGQMLGAEENYMQYSGDKGLYAYTFKHEQRTDCPLCGDQPKNLELDVNSTVQDVVEKLMADHQLKKPSLTANKKSVYVQNIASLERSTRPNLEKRMTVFVGEGDELLVTDMSLNGVGFKFQVYYSGGPMT